MRHNDLGQCHISQNGGGKRCDGGRRRPVNSPLTVFKHEKFQTVLGSFIQIHHFFAMENNRHHVRYNHSSGGSSVQEVNINTSIACLGLQCYPDIIFTAAESITVILAVLGFLGNGLTVLAILTSSLRSNLNSILIGNLSFASVLYCSLVLPLQAVAFHYRQWVLPDEVCVVQAAVRIWLVGVNMSLLSAIALYRFIHVVYPQSYPKWSESKIFYPTIAFTWIFAVFFCAAPMLGWGSYRFEPLSLQCTFNSQNPDKSHKSTVVTIGYLIPCVFISVCYARIGCVVYRSRTRALRGSLYGRKKSQRGSLRLTAMMLLIFLGFFVGTTPYFTINVIDSRQTFPMVHIWAPCAAWLLYCLNPVIYTLMDQNFLQAYKQLVCCLLCSEGDTTRQNSLRSRPPSIK